VEAIAQVASTRSATARCAALRGTERTLEAVEAVGLSEQDAHADS
jgi:hypothetical protein